MNLSAANAARPEVSTSRAASDAPLAGFAGHDLAGRFRHWRGLSGRRHMFSVFPLGATGGDEQVPRFEDAVVLAVRHEEDGRRRILFADETGGLPDLFFASAGFRGAVADGAREVHVHLLSDGARARAALLRDLADH